MLLSTLRIATRKSPLALWQANFIGQQLQQRHPQLTIQIIPLVTQGDQILDRSLTKVGGKGLFVKELEKALLNQQADIAVHSMKDVPATFPAGLCLPVICQRAEACDALVCPHSIDFIQLPIGSKVGTSSLRRQSQLKHLRADLNILPLRGNVNTRLQKLDRGDFDAIVLAAAGLQRLNFTDRIQHLFTIDQLLPAPGQGALGIECRQTDQHIRQLIAPLHDPLTALCLHCERTVSSALGGSCQVPLAVHAQFIDQQISICARVAHPSGKPLLESQIRGACDQADPLAQQVITDLKAQGALALIQQVLAQS
ncbi:MAG: hydroxymethylbilane synthase [Legionellales bacterium]|nr:hydroxymethylbilane synthase [Legionellales bacterium]